MSSLVNYNVRGAGKRTSMRLELEAWDALRDICRIEQISIEELVTRAVRTYPDGGRTSAVRVFLLMYYRSAYRALAGLPADGIAAPEQVAGELGLAETGSRIVQGDADQQSADRASPGAPREPLC
jgi:predicted DNA-binding ribbon-helix-helix protein